MPEACSTHDFRHKSQLNSPNWAEGVQALGSGPRETLLLGSILHVASRHVDGKGVAGDVLLGLGGRDVPAVLANDNAELDLMVRNDTLGDLDVLSRGDVGRGWLQKEEGLCLLA